MRVVLLKILILLTVCAFGQEMADLRQFSEGLNKPIWEFKTDTLTKYCIISKVHFYDSILIVRTGETEGCSLGKIYGLSTNTGKIKWERINNRNEGNYIFQQSNIMFTIENRIICLDVYTGKVKWTYDKYGYFIRSLSFNSYFLDSTMYFLASNYYSRNDTISIENDSIGYTGVISINFNTGEELFHFKNLHHRRSWDIEYIKNNLIVVRGNKIIFGYDLEKDSTIWSVNELGPFIGFGNEPAIERGKKYFGYTFLTGKGDTVLLSRTTYKRSFKKGTEEIIALELKTGKIIKTFYAGALNEQLLQSNYLKRTICMGNLAFMRRSKITNKWLPKEVQADYELVCIDMNTLEEKLFYRKRKYDIFSDRMIKINADSSSVILTVDDVIISTNPNTGIRNWIAWFRDAEIRRIQTTNNYFFVTLYINHEFVKQSYVTIINDKADPYRRIIEDGFSILATNENDVYILLESKRELLKIKINKSTP